MRKADSIQPRNRDVVHSLPNEVFDRPLAPHRQKGVREHFRIEGRRTCFETVEEMQAALDAYLVAYNNERPHQGRGMNGRTPYRAFLDRIPANDNSQEDTAHQTEQATAA